ncbi:hypothetical protein WICANDRAFT_35832, partial [Wickerhamomyces anomalus NRRL Y-366-8]
KVRYTNNSNYRRDELIRKEFSISAAVVKQLKKIVAESEILKEDDAKWPPKNRDGKQELEIKAGRYHISFETTKLGSLTDVRNSEDPEGLRVFYYFVQDIKALIFSLISLHFKVCNKAGHYQMQNTNPHPGQTYMNSSRVSCLINKFVLYIQFRDFDYVRYYVIL